jgi:hypothetical protein
MKLNHRSLFIVAASAMALLQSVQPATAVIGTLFSYSLKDDWSNTQNPTGPWSYNYNDSPITVFQTFWWGDAGWGNISIGDGAILKANNYPTGVTDPWGNVIAPPHDWQSGDVMMHALSEPYGGLSTFLNVRWTSPADGMIDISGRAWEGEIFADRDVAWSLIVDGQTIAARNSMQGLYRTDTGAQFSANVLGGNSLTGIPVLEGDVVEFRVSALTYYGHFVGVEANIDLTVVPEPGPMGLLAAGLVGLLGFRKLTGNQRLTARAD